MTKAELNLSILFWPLRPALRRAHLATSSPRPLSQFAPLRDPSFPRPPYTSKKRITRSPFVASSLQGRRLSHSTSTSPSAVAHQPQVQSDSQSPSEKPPAYELTFTCKPCKHRSTHTVSKQGYHKGTVLITCPECSNRHVISDHLKIFGDRSFTIEDLMRQKGQLVKRGTLDAKGDVEFWDDASYTENRVGSAQ